MIRMHVLTLGMLIIAQASTLQCPLGTDAGTPDFVFTPTPRTIPTFADRSTDTAEVGDEVSLFAEADDIGGGAIFFSWVQVGGPGVRIEDSLSEEAFFVAPSVGSETTLEFLVTTRNAAGDVGRATIDVTVEADPSYQPPGPDGTPVTGGGTRGPNANAGSDQSVEAGSTVILSGAASSGAGLTFSWAQVFGPTLTLEGASSGRLTFTAPDFVNGGTNRLEFELTVTDVRGRRDTDRIVIKISSAGSGDNPQVRVVTNFGNITVELFPQEAPITVANFLEYVDDDFYDGLIFHRVIAGFVIQGGGFQPGLTPRDGRDPIILESRNGLQNDRGTIAMARTNDPNSASSEFYFNLVDNNDLNFSEGPPVVEGYAVFGRIIEGLSVIDRIGAVDTESRQGFNDVPVQDVIIQRVERVAQ